MISRSKESWDVVQLAARPLPSAPTRVVLIEGGRLETLQGTFVVDERSVASIQAINQAMTEKWLPWDYHHSTQRKCTGADEGVAAGWFQLQVESHGVKGHSVVAAPVEWTAEGKRRIEAKEFLFFSPVILTEGIEGRTERRVMAVLSCALTNTPATLRQRPLIELERVMSDWSAVVPMLPAGAVVIGDFEAGVVCYRVGPDLYTAKVGGTPEAPILENQVKWTRGEKVELAASAAEQALVARVRELEAAEQKRSVESLLSGGVVRGAILPAEVTRLTALGLTGAVGLAEVKARAEGPVLIKGPGAQKPDTGISKEVFARMTAAERESLSRTAPALYLKLVQ